MNTFEYTDIRLRSNDIEGSRKQMNLLGSDGWELVSVVQENQTTNFHGNTDKRAYFKRKASHRGSTYGVIE